MGRSASQINKKGREKRIKISEDLLWGIHPVFEALQNEPERIAEIFIIKGKHGTKWEELIESARKEKTKLSFVDSFKISGENASQVRHQGVIARMSTVALSSSDAIIDLFAEKTAAQENPVLIVCDTLQDPHNLGAIIRSAYASGMIALVTTAENSAPLGGIVAKSAAGAMSHLPICRVTNLSDFLMKLKKVGAWVFGAVKDDDAVSLYSADLNLPAVIVVGSEGKGIRPLVKKHCDILISIPMAGDLDSLNSSVAAAVIMFESLRQKSSR